MDEPLGGDDPDPAEVVQVVTVVDDAELAAELARVAVAARTAACVQVEGPLSSTYRWEGEIRTDREWRVVAKTTGAGVDAVIDTWLQLHTYDLPEVVVVPVIGGHGRYLEWVREEVGLSPDSP